MTAVIPVIGWMTPLAIPASPAPNTMKTKAEMLQTIGREQLHPARRLGFGSGIFVIGLLDDVVDHGAMRGVGRRDVGV